MDDLEPSSDGRSGNGALRHQTVPTLGTETFDVVCIGGGTAGMTAARIARGRGRSVALIESEAGLGGDCTYWGCVPSKTLISIAGLAAQNQRHAGLGFVAAPPDFARVMAHQRGIVAAAAHRERAQLFERDGISVISGPARLESAQVVRVGERVLGAGRVVIATGTDPVLPPIPGLEQTPHLTNRTIFALTQLPERLLVLGGGPIGLELGQAMARLGSQVTILEAADTLLTNDEPDAGRVLEDALRGEGIDVQLGATTDRVRARGEEVSVSVTSGDQQRELVADALLVAVGRAPRTSGLNLEALGVKTDARGFIEVDRRMRASQTHLYAAGDVTGGLQFTHVAAYEGQIAGANASGGRKKASYRVIPWVTFTDPEVAHVGLTEAQARDRHGGQVRVATYPMRLVDRAAITGRPEGFIKLITRQRGRIGRATGGTLLAAQIVGAHAGELIHEAVISMQARTFTGRLAQAVHAYPSMSVGIQQASAQLFADGRLLAPVGDEAAPDQTTPKASTAGFGISAQPEAE
ncbi:MAG: dihydrolipoyl dehydrogenase family protein [Solirubrobacteraceae bacterium]